MPNTEVKPRSITATDEEWQIVKDRAAQAGVSISRFLWSLVAQYVVSTAEESPANTEKAGERSDVTKMVPGKIEMGLHLGQVDQPLHTLEQCRKTVYEALDQGLLKARAVVPGKLIGSAPPAAPQKPRPQKDADEVQPYWKKGKKTTES